MKIRLAAAQYPITAFPHFADWQEHVGRWVADAARQGAQLLLFPEYGSMELASLLPDEERGDLRRQIDGLERWRPDFLETFTALAREWNVVIAAPSFPVREGGEVFNRVYVCSPKGLSGFQDKLFMTRFEDEEWGIQGAPPTLTLFETDWGAFGIQTCYDVEFPLGSQVLCAHGAELILAPSCTETIRGATRAHVGARARALENQCFVAVAQTVGDAPWSPAVDVNYGYAALYAPPDIGLPEEGIVAQSQPQEPGWLVRELDLELVREVRKAGQVLNFRDQQRLEYRLQGKKIEVGRWKV
jgi:predicted amidohydrolase